MWQSSHAEEFPYWAAGHQKFHVCVKVFGCDHCKRAITLRGNLITHQKIHIPVKEIKCYQCNKVFTHGVTLQRIKILILLTFSGEFVSKYTVLYGLKGFWYFHLNLIDSYILSASICLSLSLRESGIMIIYSYF